MSESERKLLFWAPRVLAILFAVFLGLFAFDEFAENTGLVQTLTALVMHLTPTLLILALLALAWRWEWIGSFAFAVLGISYVIVMWGRFPWFTYVAISGPLLLTSALFFVSWKWGVDARASGE